MVMEAVDATTRTVIGAPRWITAREERAHAMKNQLSSIRLMGRILSRVESPHRNDWLERFDAAVMRLAALVEQDLRDGDRRPEADLGLDDTDVVALFEAARERLVDRAAYANVTLTFDCAPAWLQGAKDDLSEAVYNLVANALEATPVGGTVSVRTRVTATGDHAWEIHDSGCGIPPDVLTRVGRRRCSERKEGGTGLGLAIAAAAIGAQGGLLEVGPGVSGGTRMVALLPPSPRPS